eukprot:scaffold4083_cov95-Cylindrotheca_fusiformis.AAC.2
MAMSGIVEAICLRRFKVFPNMMTGNTVRCMDALAEMKWNKVLLYSGMIASYVSGSALYKFLDTAEVFPPNKKLPNLVWLSRITLGIFCVSDFLGLYRDTLRLIPLAIAFGMINTATQEAIGAVTNAATGHYGKIGFGLGEVLAMKRRLQTSADPNNNNSNQSSSATTQAAITTLDTSPVASTRDKFGNCVFDLALVVQSGNSNNDLLNGRARCSDNYLLSDIAFSA